MTAPDQHSGYTEKQILVTGATGFLGSYLIHFLLQQGYTRIRALRQPSSPMDMLKSCLDRIIDVEADLLDLPALDAAIEGCDWVFHCAGVVSFDPRKARLMRQVNVEGTANVANLCLIHGVESMLHVSSIAALGRVKPGQHISEQSKWERSPLNTRYGISKFQGEQEVWRAIEEGLNAVIVNPAVIIGSGDWEHGPARFFRMIDRGFSFYPQGSTDMVDVRDVVRAMTALMEGGIRRERFIVSAGKVSYRQFFDQVARALNKPSPTWSIAPWMQEVAWMLAWVKSMFGGGETLITRETVQQSALEYTYDNEKLIRALGFQYTPVAQTIEETAQKYLDSQQDDTLPKLLSFG